jgi:ferredoxin
MPSLHEHFRMVPRGYESDDLVPVADYLGRDDEAVGRLVPFVWGIDEDGTLVRLAISRALVFACQDRLNYWRTLQELAGVHNFYVEAAIERVLEDARAAADAEREELLKSHAEELDSARSEAAGEAMGQLVDVLMGADLSSMVGGSAPATMPAPSEAPAKEAAAAEPAAEPEPEPEEEDEVSFDEPWIDSAACTTCDDCLNINKMMFAYNEDKQAYLKDPRAGTYEELVRAAETCPAKCIHPGKPLNPSEPDLEALIARAEPFN